MRFFCLSICLLLATLPCPAPACSLCGTLGNKLSLVQEFDQAQAVLYGYIDKPKLEGTGGQGTTEFHVTRIVKDDPGLPRQKMILLSRYLPILEAKEPPRYLMFFAAPQKNLEPYTGRQLNTAGILDYLVEYQRHRSNSTEALLFAARHFDDADPTIAEEAFLAFARANDKRIGELARQLAPEKLRKMVQTPNLEPERLSMFAFLLGACGNDEDAELLSKLLKGPGEHNYKAFEGILAGYMTARPQLGWSYALETLKDGKQSFLVRYATIRALRFFYQADRAQYGRQVIQAMGLALVQSDIADIAIQDLRQWKCWEHTPVILSLYNKKSHQSPIVKNSIVRYCLACPNQEARAFIERVRRLDAELIKDLEEEMSYDRKK